MDLKKVVIFLLLLTFFSGAFTMSRISGSLPIIEVKYIIFVALFVVVLPEINSRGFSKNIINLAPLSYFVVMTFIFFQILFASSLISEDLTKLLDGFIDLLFMGSMLIILLHVISQYEKEEFFWFLTGFVILIGLIYVIPVYFSVLSGDVRGRFALGGHNVTTRILFFASICSLYRYSIKKNLIYFMGVPLFLSGIVFGGSRGGLIGSVATIVVLWLFLKVIRKPRIVIIKSITISFKKILYYTLAIGVLVLVYNPLKRVFESRVIKLMFNRGDEGIYTSGRDVIYSRSIEMIKEKPILGHGLGGYTVKVGGSYPHNLLLELMINIGILGAVFFLIFILFSVYIIYKLKGTSLYVFSGLPLYMIIVQLFSGGLYDFRYYFFWSFILLYYSTISKSNNKGIKPNLST